MLTILSYFNLVDIGRTLIYSIVVILLLPLFNTYFSKYKIMDMLGKSKNIIYLIYILAFFVPFLFINKRYIEGTVLLCILLSMTYSTAKRDK